MICGVGLPVDLEVESVTVGYVFKTEYFLPYNLSQWDPAKVVEYTPIGRRRRGVDFPESLFADDEQVLQVDSKMELEELQERKKVYNADLSRLIAYKTLEKILER